MILQAIFSQKHRENFSEDVLARSLEAAVQVDERNSEICHMDWRTGLVISRHQYTVEQLIRDAMPAQTAEEKLLQFVFRLLPEPFVRRSYYTVPKLGATAETPVYQRWASLTFGLDDVDEDGLVYFPKRIDFTDLNSRGSKVSQVTLELTSDFDDQKSTVVRASDFKKKRALELAYSVNGEMYFMFVNPLSAEANYRQTENGFIIGEREAEASDQSRIAAEFRALNKYSELGSKGVTYSFTPIRDAGNTTSFIGVAARDIMKGRVVIDGMRLPIWLDEEALWKAYVVPNLRNNPMSHETDLDRFWLRSNIPRDANIIW